MRIYCTSTFRACGYRVKNNRDLKNFLLNLDQDKIGVVVGLGNTDGGTRIESRAINYFRNRRITSDGPEEYRLSCPKIGLPISSKATTSYCNRLAYKVSDHIRKNNLRIENIFVHINPHDSVSSIIKKLGG